MKNYLLNNFQCVVDHEMKFTNNYTGWPGCVHDARVLRNSALYREGKAGNLILRDHHIFGYSAYPLRNWLVVIWLHSKRLSSARQSVERHLKGCFRRLQYVLFHDSMEVCKMILSACILHSLCIINSDEVEDYINVRDEDPNDCQNIYQNGQNGVVRRLQLDNINWCYYRILSTRYIQVQINVYITWINWSCFTYANFDYFTIFFHAVFICKIIINFILNKFLLVKL